MAIPIGKPISRLGFLLAFGLTLTELNLPPLLGRLLALYLLNNRSTRHQWSGFKVKSKDDEATIMGQLTAVSRVCTTSKAPLNVLKPTLAAFIIMTDCGFAKSPSVIPRLISNT